VEITGQEGSRDGAAWSGALQGAPRKRGFYIAKRISLVDRSLVLNSNSISYILVIAYYFQVLLVILVFNTNSYCNSRITAKVEAQRLVESKCN
jgi:hypothetical protein